MRLLLHLLPSPRARAALPARCFASYVIPPYGRAAAYRRILSQSAASTSRSSQAESQIISLSLQSLTADFLPKYILSSTSRSFSTSKFRFENQQQGQNIKDPPRPRNSTNHSAREETADSSSEETSKKSSGEGDEEPSGQKSNEDKSKESDEKEDKKTEDPPPPPHGDKTPWQVFTETLRSEFQASKEWNESTKALASSAHQFTENESVKRARAAYSAASGAATSTTSSAFRETGKVLGKGAAWTWDTPVVKGVRSGVKATGRGIEKATRPVRETAVYKTTVGGVKDVIDDGSSSKYGGWVEKEERRKQRELRELSEAAMSGGPGKNPEKVEEDPKSVIS